MTRLFRVVFLDGPMRLSSEEPSLNIKNYSFTIIKETIRKGWVKKALLLIRMQLKGQE